MAATSYTDREFASDGASPSAPVRVEGLRKSYDGETNVIDGIDFEVARGDVVAVIGPSGAGKSTLIRCLNLLESPTAGDIWIQGRKTVDAGRVTVNRKELQRLRGRVGMVFQSFNLFPHMSALDNVSFAQVRANGKSRGEADGNSRRLLEQVGLADHLAKTPAQLSGGQQQRVAIARALAVDPDVMLFDEPTSAIDPERRLEVLSVMRDLARAGMTMAIVTHEMHFARNVANRILFVADGRIVEEGRPEDVLISPKTERLQQFLSRVEEVGL